MNSFLRKIVVALVLAVSVCSPLLPSAAAHPTPPTVPGHSHTRYFLVYYRTDVHSPWVYYGYTASHSDALWYANWIWSSYGYETFVR